MKKILCPTDFSDTANNAIAYAAKLAQKTSAGLTLFTVHSLGELTPEEAIVGAFQNETLAQSRLEQQCDEVRAVFRIPCSAEVSTSIISVNKFISSRGQQYDLIVMGSNGPDNLVQFFLGSNTYQVIQKSQTPVLLIPEGCGYSEVRTIVYAFDYRRNERLPIAQLLLLSKSLGSELRVLQVIEGSYTRKAEVEIKALQDVFNDLYKDEVPISFDTIYTSDLIDSLHVYTLRSTADVLALCTEHHGFLQKLFHKSVVKALTERASYPLFVFHA